MSADEVQLIVLFLFPHYSSSVLNKAGTLHCIFLMYCLVLSQHTEYPDLFLWFSSVPPGMCQDISPTSLCKFPTPLFPMHYSLLFMRSDGVEYILMTVPVNKSEKCDCGICSQGLMLWLLTTRNSTKMSSVAEYKCTSLWVNVTFLQLLTLHYKYVNLYSLNSHDQMCCV